MQYTNAMEEWLTCTTLDPLERELVQHLRDQTVKDLNLFWASVRTVTSTWPDVIGSAITKARAQGLCRSWK